MTNRSRPLPLDRKSTRLNSSHLHSGPFFRSADELTARLGAEVGMLAFSVALGHWMEANDDEPFPPFAARSEEHTSELQSLTLGPVLPICRRVDRATGGGGGHARFQRRPRALDGGER